MPKSRTTCTRCSMRRQKCDRRQPCSRCVQADDAASCTRTWTGGYDARVHRAYPKGPTQHGGVTRRSPAAHSSPTRSTPGVHSESISRTLPAPRPTEDDNNNNALLNGTHSESDPFRPEEDVRGFDYYARFRQGEMSYLQSCLPNHLLIFQLVEYHEKYLLWFHHCIHGPTFRKDVLSVLQSAGNSPVQLKDLDLRWCALLFAVLSASITCATDKQAQIWNLDCDEKQNYSKKWHEAAMECLVLGEFASKPHVYSIQTVQILTLSALIIGLSSQQFVMFGTSLRLAQSLGLQRLPDELGEQAAKLNDAARIQRETSRRVWWNLVMQDWLSISSHDMFSVHPQHFTTARPHHLIEGDAELSEDDTLTDYMNWILDVSTVMVEFHMASVACTDTDSKYELVLKYDARLRRVGSQAICPNGTNVAWVPWARHVGKVMHAHKIIILHRHFLGRSLRDDAFAYTRWASVEASKLIIREVEQSFEDPERPTCWTDQSHLTGAGVTLCLDTMHRSDSESEHSEHLRLVEKTMHMLAGCKNSVLASRGHRLLSSMLREGLKDTAEKDVPESRRAPPSSSGENEFSWPIENREKIDAMRSTANIAVGQTGHPTPMSQRDISSPRPSQQIAPLPSSTTGDRSAPGGDMGPYGFEGFIGFPTGGAEGTGDVSAEASWTELLSEFFPDQLGFGNALAFDDLFNDQFPT